MEELGYDDSPDVAEDYDVSLVGTLADRIAREAVKNPDGTVAFTTFQETDSGPRYQILLVACNDDEGPAFDRFKELHDLHSKWFDMPTWAESDAYGPEWGE